MRQYNKNVLSAGDSLNTNGEQIDANQIIAASFMAYFGDNNAAGTFKLQASNDVTPLGNVVNMANYVATNWADIPLQTATIASGGTALLTITQSVYRFIRAVFTSTGTGAQTVVPIADTGVKQTQTATAAADVAGSLNSSYFLLSSVNLVSKAAKNFYVWLDNGAGVDPAIAGRTGVQVVYANDDTANTIAGNIRTQLALLTNDFTITGATNQVIVTNKAAGPVIAMSNGTPSPGTVFSALTLGVASNLNNKYFYLNSANAGTKYAVYMNVDAIGTAPVISGYTALSIPFASGSSAGTIGTALAAAVDPLANFIATGTTLVTITNSASGPFTPISDAGLTGFTFAITAGGTSTVNVNMNVLSM